MANLIDNTSTLKQEVLPAAGLSEQPPSYPGPERRRVPRTAKPHLFVTLCHWSMVLLLALNLLTGMRIGWGYLESPLGGNTGTWGAILGAIAPKGSFLGVNVITLHVTLAFLLLLVAGVYVIYLFRSHTRKRWQVTRKDLSNLYTGLRTKNFWRSKPAMWCANVLVYWLSCLFIVVLVATGIALYRLDWGLSTLLGGYSEQRVVHALVAYLLLPYTLLHMLLEWGFGRFWTIFKAHLHAKHIQAGFFALAIVLPVIGGLYLGETLPTTLPVKRLANPSQAPVLDGDPRDPIWNQVEAVTVRTVKGVNNPQDYVDIQVKAVYDGADIYFQLQWDDPDVSYKRFPLFKTEHGWKVLQTAFANADENVYYEDKLSMYITDVPNGSCAATCHLGVGPYSARNEKHGLHYTSHGEIGDVWHWKSVRTNPMGELAGAPGYLDDQHFRPPEPVPADPSKDRYTGGYFPDPKSGGGYDYNFVKLDPGKALSATSVRPKMLPRTNTILPNPAPSTSEQGVTWWIHKSQGIPYTPEADTYPVGSLIPNILIEPFQGDRGDVRGQGAWQEGRWTVEVRRALNTRSQYDVAFVPGRPVYITIAAYNRTQTRHSEHIKPVRAVLQP
jgi:cytochrome b subunit of formate dehydrogenase